MDSYNILLFSFSRLRQTLGSLSAEQALTQKLQKTHLAKHVALYS